MAFDSTEFRAGQRKLWAAGSRPDVAPTIQQVADALVERCECVGQDLLDVGTGSGNVAIAAARAGAARVVGSDITVELFDAGRERAAEAGVEIEWVEGDAAELPFEDASFDRVLSVFGAIFAPDHRRTAAELARVVRPGGVIGVCGWTPAGAIGQSFQLMRSVMPEPPPEVQPPVLWGSEDHVRGLFEGLPVSFELTFEPAMATWEWESADAWIAFSEERLGPTIAARRVLQEQGRWEELRPRLVEVFENGSEPYRVESEYMRTLARRSD